MDQIGRLLMLMETDYSGCHLFCEILSLRKLLLSRLLEYFVDFLEYYIFVQQTTESQDGLG